MNGENSAPDREGIRRRTVIKGAAWSVPVIAAATALPHAAASPACSVTVPGWSGWSGSNTGSFTAGTCGNPQPEPNGMWWQWCDASTTSNYTLTKCATVTMVAGKTYTITFTTQANRSNPVPDSPANLVLAIGGAQVWAGYTVGSTGKSANPGGANAQQLTTAGNGSNFTNQTWTVLYTAPTTGDVLICYTWTAYQRTSANGSASTDDIGTSLPSITCS
ncbi:hypothetical protein [Microbacterium sp. 13-71-7]|jgi:hypothetical protein|uniref:hypothetical protein n=1 Tax=Microbacterium sp. 13-71-7 TaxID=1970399 RepID=UPI000BCF445E|nr:hypothetical protein [Microbacterium sp. 13-71-7]OZB83358.1 MAG: hypothetical protein B7X32_10610 [Microbacterium sp. 13-71-7]